MKLNDFKCMQCGECCRWQGYVRLEKSEPDIIANELGLDVHDFIDKYTILTKDRRSLSLIEDKDGSCIFLSYETGECEINSVKPRQCREFPMNWSFPGWDKICKWGKGK